MSTQRRRASSGAAAEGVRLRIQGLPGPMQVLAVGALASMQSQERTFTTRQVSELLTHLRLPPIANVSSTLGRLGAQHLLMRPTKSTWALTPLGEARLNDNTLRLQLGALPANQAQPSGAEFGEQQHTLIPPFLSPVRASLGLQRILDVAPFEQNVMLITRYPKAPEDDLAQLFPKLRRAVAEHDLVLQVASDGNAEDTLWANVVTYMWACKYAIVIMDSADGLLNSNVLIEIGGMLMTGRRCAILRDKSVPAMPSDLVGHIYRPTDLADHDASVEQVHRWIRDDLGLSACESCPPSS